MGIYEQAFGRAYTRDESYAALTGYQVATYTFEWYDSTRNVMIRTTRQVINLGRSDPVVPADPEAFLESPGPFPLRKLKKHGKTDEFEAQVYDVLCKRPLNANGIAAALGCTVNRVKGLIRNHPEGFEIIARGTSGCLYGIPGHKYTEPIYQRGMERILKFLKEFGPQTGPTICEGLGIQPEAFAAAREANPGAVVVTGVTDCRGASKRLISVWGVADGQ